MSVSSNERVHFSLYKCFGACCSGKVLLSRAQQLTFTEWLLFGMSRLVYQYLQVRPYRIGTAHRIYRIHAAIMFFFIFVKVL
jgi:hypothetical protein